jgi:hypothetical protein
MGDVFPAEDRVGRFVVTLAMITNDVVRSTALFPDLTDDNPEARGRRVMIFRYQAAAFHEIATFIGDARKLPEIAGFITSLPNDVSSAPATIEDLARQLEPWLVDHRNVTFHYPEMNDGKIVAGKDDVMIALAKVADMESEIVADEAGGTAGFPFADEVVAQLLPDDFAARAAVLRRGIMAALDFATAAVTAYMSGLPAGTLMIVEPTPGRSRSVRTRVGQIYHRARKSR